jgi:hypothetical protein
VLHPWCRRLVRWCELFFSSAKRRVKAGRPTRWPGPRWQKENEHIRVLKTGCWQARVLGWGVHL